jgi:hypothetical protein
VFYLLADTMLGCLAYLTGSALPGIVVHAVGLFVFFTLIWPGDSSRRLLAAGGADTWFWVHAGQVLLAIPGGPGFPAAGQAPPGQSARRRSVVMEEESWTRNRTQATPPGRWTI